MKILVFFKNIPDTRYCICQMSLSFTFVKYSKTVIKIVFKQWKITIWPSIGFKQSQQRWKNWCRISYSSISGPDGDVIWLLSTVGERDWQDAQRGADTFVRSAVHTTAWQWWSRVPLEFTQCPLTADHRERDEDRGKREGKVVYIRMSCM